MKEHYFLLLQLLPRQQRQLEDFEVFLLFSNNAYGVNAAAFIYINNI